MSKQTVYSVTSGFLIALAGTLLMLTLLSLHLVGPESVKNDKLMIGGTILFISLYVFLLFGIYSSMVYAKKIAQKLTFKKAFITGLIVSFATAFFSVLFTLLFYEIIYPNYNADMTVILTEKLSNQNLREAEMIEKINEQTKYYSTAMQAQFSFVGNLITGIAFSLLLSLFLKSKKN
ncbi:DUF4199 domain-containing protein [Maribacter ulvicola]|uniref:DUF4199 domain-containing protein n=1 Tax=Maribacter ulvicola TaxID=228959 RepID=A0A1N6RVK3_9FLAO|nr:DUF4199 domain-containing protein [Maribacter ulvicola]SIQ32756.1 Protein of unknown function [Maribacter ulvicola]